MARGPLDPVVSQSFRMATPADPERVWAALTSPAETTRYFHGLSVRSSWRVGATVAYDAAGTPPGPSGLVLDAVPAQRLSYTVEDTDGPATYLTWSLRPGCGGSVVRLDVHEAGPGGSPEDIEDVWLPVLEALRVVLADPTRVPDRP